MNVFQHLAATDRRAFSEIRRRFQDETRKQPKVLTEVPIDPGSPAGRGAAPLRAWRSREFAAFLYLENGNHRITVNRSEIDNDGNWKDGITWDDLMRVKREIGFGDRLAVEIYPPDDDVVNVANMRHLWVVGSLPFGWHRDGSYKEKPV